MSWPWGKKAVNTVGRVVKHIGAALSMGGSVNGEVIHNAKAVAREYYRNMYLWFCVDKISTTAGVPPLYVKTEKDRALSAYELAVKKVLDNPNPQWTRSSMSEYLSICVATLSRAFILVIRGVGNTPLELWPLNPLWMQVEYIEGTTTVKLFRYTIGGMVKTYPVDENGDSEIIFIQRPSLNSCEAAASPAEVAVPAAEVFNRILQKAADVAGNASNVTGVLSSEADVDQTQVEKVK